MAASNASGTTASEILHSLLVDQLYAKEVCVSAVLWKNPIKHASNIHPNVFNSFCQTVTHGESHRIIYKEIHLSMVTPFFCIWTSQQKSPKQVLVNSVAHHHPLSSEITLGDTWIQLLLTNFLSFNLPQYKSNHHKAADFFYCFKPLILRVFTTVAFRLKSEQKEKEK